MAATQAKARHGGAATLPAVEVPAEMAAQHGCRLGAGAGRGRPRDILPPAARESVADVPDR
jgi:hypothetical protein